MDIAQLSIVYHFGLVLAVLWISSSFNCCHPVVYFISFIYLYLVNERYILRLRKRLHHEEKKQAYQKRILSDSETVRWLNHLLVKVWPICMEQIASQKILLPIVPWFLEKYKPWTAKKVVVQELYLGRNPPLITEMRVVGQSADDDHLVLELGLNFLSADDMSAILAVQLRKRLGFGMWTKLHLTGMHIEAKVLVGVKFLQNWPFLQRIRLCFVQPPYFQMIVKPIFSHGLDVTEVPGIAGWLDKVLAMAFEETLVEPNMLVVDLEKLVGSTESASTPEGGWFSVDERKPIAYAKVEIIEADNMKPSDPNGLADPYVKGHMGPYRFKTKIQRKTLAPKWQEEFKIPICTWESPNVLELEIRDKDLFLDDTLGNCSIIVNDLRGGQRHDKWLSLKNIKMGRLHMAITVAEVDPTVKQEEVDANDQAWSQSGEGVPVDKDMARQEPGSDVSTTWEPRKGRSRNPETEIPREGPGTPDSPACTGSVRNDNSSEEEEILNQNQKPIDSIKRKMVSLFSRDRKTDDTKNSKEDLSTPRPNLKAEGEKGNGVVLVLDDVPEDFKEQLAGNKTGKEGSTPQKCEADSSPKNAKNVAKSIIKHAGKSAHQLKHRLSKKISSKSRSSTNPEGSDKSNLSDEESNTGLEGDSPKAEDLPVDPVLQECFPFNSRGHDGSPVQSPLLPEHVVNSRVSVGSCEESSGLRRNASISRNSC
ncbi:C2 domain-containing protein At1g53590-like isoform X3 [Nymphaea colorata]|uniref:C2 domain-containing protein At1g53590-like isoform X3 n=1 Tax=Nymphaea colorata TaxID=210225 RepID=UPI00129E87A1|nr:C2 domain-containing protein At1g53590-like isoform X3 [Nymphaea colorata]